MFEDFAIWLKDTLLWIPRKLWAEMLEALSGILDAIPVPDFMTDASGYMSGIPSGVLWTLDLFAVKEGAAMIVAALVLRFVVRRIPIIG
jgi:hypothetical protein